MVWEENKGGKKLKVDNDLQKKEALFEQSGQF